MTTDDTLTDNPALLAQAKLIEQILVEFGAPATVLEVSPGPTVTQFGVQPGPKIKAERIGSLATNLALGLAVPSIRVELPIPGRPLVGIEVPNAHRQTVTLDQVIDSDQFRNYTGALKIALGLNIAGRPVVDDLAKMPHLLIAGATQSGKSVALNAIIAGFLRQYDPDYLKLIMIDPKKVELAGYTGIPHLLFDVVTQVERSQTDEDRTSLTALNVLHWLVGEMEWRYDLLAAVGRRNIESYNALIEREPPFGQSLSKLPYIVLIIDELADLMMTAPQEIESDVTRLAQKARAVGIHLIVATQRPSVDVVTGLIKANIPGRIAFAVTSQTDSRVILDTGGAENLLGAGDMLYLAPGQKLRRVQGVYASDDELTELVDSLRAAGGPTRAYHEIPPRPALPAFLNAVGLGRVKPTAAPGPAVTKTKKEKATVSPGDDVRGQLQELRECLAAQDAQIAELKEELARLIKLLQLSPTQPGRKSPTVQTANKATPPPTTQPPVAPVIALRSELNNFEKRRLDPLLARIKGLSEREKALINTLIKADGQWTTKISLGHQTGIATGHFNRDFADLLKLPMIESERGEIRAKVRVWSSANFGGVKPEAVMAQVKAALKET